MKVVIAYLCNYEDRRDYYISLLPVGTVSLAAYLEQKGFKITLANFSFHGHRKAAMRIAEIKPDVIGLSLFTHNRRDTLELAKQIKKSLPLSIIIAGGPHASFLAEELKKRTDAIDHIIVGEGEKAFTRTLRRLESELSVPPVITGENVNKLDRLPAPGEYAGKTIGVNANEQFKYIITSRGCVQSCSFCCSPSMWGREVRFRSAVDVVNEIEYLYRKYGILYFSLRDDNFTLDKKRVLKFTQLLRERKLFIMWNCQSRVDNVDMEMLVEMKKAGLEHIQYGVESGSEKILKRYDKRITRKKIINAARLTRDAGIYLSVYLMAGMKDEKYSDIIETINLIRQIQAGDGIVSPVALYPGTKLYEILKKEGVFSDSIWFDQDDPGIFLRNDAKVLQWMHMLLGELEAVRERAWYRASDFTEHRHVCGEDCWVTDVLEGDYFLDEELFDRAESCYRKINAAFPENPWGYLRLGKSGFFRNNFPEALRSFSTLIKIVPRYYGGHLKKAECYFALGEKDRAKKSLEKASRFNSHDRRIKNLWKLLR